MARLSLLLYETFQLCRATIRLISQHKLQNDVAYGVIKTRKALHNDEFILQSRRKNVAMTFRARQTFQQLKAGGYCISPN